MSRKEPSRSDCRANVKQRVFVSNCIHFEQGESEVDKFIGHSCFNAAKKKNEGVIDVERV